MPLIRMRDGQSIYVRVVGRGAPVLMVHGFGADGRSWLPFVSTLSRERSFILPDLRGFGRSHRATLSDGRAFHQFASDIEDVLGALGVARLPVVGISMGALTALQSFAQFGDKYFTHYLQIEQSPVIRNRESFPYGLFGEAQAPLFARFERLLAALSQGHLHQPFDRLPVPLRREFWGLFGEFATAAFSSRTIHFWLRMAARNENLMRRVVQVENWPVYLEIVRSYVERDYDLRPAVRAIKVPMTVLIGGASRMYPPAGQRLMGELAPHARVLELPGVNHNLCFQAPRVFLREFRSLLAAA